MTPDQLAAFVAEVRAAETAMHAASPHDPAWHAWFDDQGIRERWRKRPYGRDAAPGDISGGQLPGERPFGSDHWQCRRCLANSSRDGHPHGCPRTPGDIEERLLLHALRRCYCGQALVVTPDTFGPCCADTPPVPLPGGCRVCGSNLCRVNNPDDQPEHDYYVTDHYPDMGRDWVHAHCIDDDLIARGCPERAAEHRAKRHVPLGIVNP